MWARFPAGYEAEILVVGVAHAIATGGPVVSAQRSSLVRTRTAQVAARKATANRVSKSQ
jgi:hypothetical protein